MIEMPCPASVRMISNRICASRSVSAAVGSSRISTRQSSVRALAISTSCCCEIESERTGAAGSMSPRRCRISAERRSSPRKSISSARLELVAAMKMFSATVISGQSAISWCTKPMPSVCAMAGEVMVTGWPSRRISPLSGRRMPSMMFINVDLPAPFSPARAWISPLRSWNPTPRSARTGPKDLDRLVISRIRSSREAAVIGFVPS